jgi:phosphotriesterase-related protein
LNWKRFLEGKVLNFLTLDWIFRDYFLIIGMVKSVFLICIFLFLSNFNSFAQRFNKVLDSDAEKDLGIALIHEHVLVDFGGAAITGYHRWSRDTVIQRVLPFLEDVKAKGVSTIVECTPAYLGRDPRLLKELSELTGITFLTNTGYYGAVNGKYLPAHAFDETPEQLAARWIKEFEEGIEDTGIRPGFIKIGVNEGSMLSSVDAKLVHAAALTHLATGLLIVSHTGKWETAKAQLNILEQHQVNPERFVWVHAQAEHNFEHYLEAAQKGVWISLDGIAWDVEGHFDRIKFCLENGLINNLLLSHDAGWFSPDQHDGGEFVGYTALFDKLIPKLADAGFGENQIKILLVQNPAKAFEIR